MKFTKENILILLTNNQKMAEMTQAKSDPKWISHHKLEGTIQFITHLKKQISEWEE